MFTPTSVAISSKVYEATSRPPRVQIDPYQYDHDEAGFVVIPFTFSDSNELTQGRTTFGNQTASESRMLEQSQGGGLVVHTEAGLTNGKVDLF